jgi:hypothetical protein
MAAPQSVLDSLLRMAVRLADADGHSVNISGVCSIRRSQHVRAASQSPSRDGPEGFGAFLINSVEELACGGGKPSKAPGIASPA